MSKYGFPLVPVATKHKLHMTILQSHVALHSIMFLDIDFLFIDLKCIQPTLKENPRI